MASKAEAAGRKAAEANGSRAPKTHIYTLAMLTRKLIPPPEVTADRDVGEKRTAKRGSVSIKFGPMVTEAAAKASLPPNADKDTQRGAFTALAEAQVRTHYAELAALEKDIIAKSAVAVV